MQKHVVHCGAIIADEPDEIGEIGSRCPVQDEILHLAIVDAVHIECDDTDRDPDHRFFVVEKLDGLRIEWKVVQMLIEEEVDGVL
jgi:hypothetical protein